LWNYGLLLQPEMTLTARISAVRAGYVDEVKAGGRGLGEGGVSLGELVAARGAVVRTMSQGSRAMACPSIGGAVATGWKAGGLSSAEDGRALSLPCEFCQGQIKKMVSNE
jgi:hypothetical protein